MKKSRIFFLLALFFSGLGLFFVVSGVSLRPFYSPFITACIITSVVCFLTAFVCTLASGWYIEIEELKCRRQKWTKRAEVG